MYEKGEMIEMRVGGRRRGRDGCQFSSECCDTLFHVDYVSLDLLRLKFLD